MTERSSERKPPSRRAARKALIKFLDGLEPGEKSVAEAAIIDSEVDWRIEQSGDRSSRDTGVFTSMIQGLDLDPQRVLEIREQYILDVYRRYADAILPEFHVSHMAQAERGSRIVAAIKADFTEKMVRDSHPRRRRFLARVGLAR